MRWLLRSAVALGLAAAPVCGLGQGSLAVQIGAMVAEPAVARAHWGVVVTGLDGAPIYALNEGQFFQPASNAKLFTTTAAMALLGPNRIFETKVVARGKTDQQGSVAGTLSGDLVLIGGGDANLSGRELPYVSPAMRLHDEAKISPPDPLRYLTEMADQVAASGLKVVTGDVVGDDTLFPWEPYAADWSIDDMVWGYGAPVSALTINDNQLQVTVTPAAAPGQMATVTVLPALPYYTLDVHVNTVPGKTDGVVEMKRAPGSKVLRIYGTTAVDAGADVEEVAIDDPAEYAAMALKEMLEARGIKVQGVARVRGRRDRRELHGFLDQTREPLSAGLFNGTLGVGCSDVGRPQLEAGETVLATHRSVPLGEDIVATNKVSQNLHAELMLHHMGRWLTCNGSTAQGARVVRQFLVNAGLDPNDFVFYDGSGLSGHDLVTPRAVAKLLQYASTQPWFADWKKSLPVGGVDGSLEHRFTATPLKGRVFAKTGTLGEARALSGYVECASGRTVIFSILVDQHAPGTSADREVMDRMVATIAAAN